MEKLGKQPFVEMGKWHLAALISVLVWLVCLSQAGAFNLNVLDNQTGLPIVGGYRWLVEVDNTLQAQPGNISGTHARDNAISLNIHNSYAPVVTKGHSAGGPATVNVANNQRYFVSVLPDAGYTNGGVPVALGQAAATVYVNTQPIPTAQISVYAFLDQNPINNGWDEHDPPLGGCKITIKDDLGELSQDAFGNPIGSTYNPDGTLLNIGSGNVYTLTQAQFNAGGTQNPYNLKVGEALIKFLVPGKYGVTVTPPNVDDSGQPMLFSQTTTIEGTPTIDAWVKANEPQLFVEGFGTGFKHVVFGFIKTSPSTPSPSKGQILTTLPWNVSPPPFPSGGLYTGSITGTLRYNHFNRPPNNQGFHVGAVVPDGMVALNDPLAQPGIGQPAGLIFTQCDANGVFTFNNIPPGTYNLVSWDKPLDNLFGVNSVTVPPGGNGRGAAVNLGNVLVLRWFGTLEGSVFYDTNQNGFRDSGEVGLGSQIVNLRFRDGSIYQTQVTDATGEYAFSEVFPFFKWLIAEVDYTRYKPTGMTTAVDYGGPVVAGWPGNGNKNPQPQAGGLPYRIETGPVLLEAMHLFLNQTNLIDWGKINYPPNENGGIAGIVYYASTRAENDPRLGVGDLWEPGIPRVTVNLYRDDNQDGIPDGPAIKTTTTDSWDDTKPSGCIQTLPVVHGVQIKECADAYGTWNQVRPGVFDGGYAFGPLVGDPQLTPGTYIVEVIPPLGYELVKEEDKNVDFGNEYTPSLLALPPACVGVLHTVPAVLTLFPGVPAPFAGQQRPLCNRKQVQVAQGKNTAADFFLFTEVPKAARAVGFVNNDLGAEFNMASPNFGEKLAAAWIPISFRDWTGREIARVYSDEYGGYNTMLPATFSANVPTPTGYSPNMITLILNDPIRADGTPDPFYNPVYSVTPWTFNYMPGKTAYLDTPLVPLAAFSAGGGTIDTEPAVGTPVIRAVNGPEPGGGPLLCSARTTGRILTITSLGSTVILNPNYNPSNPTTPYQITRDYGFGPAIGQVTLNGTPLTINSWANGAITATVPAGVNTTGQLTVRRGDNGLWAEIGLTLHIVDCAATTILRVVPGAGGPIQAAIDAAAAGDLILVAAGNYNENVIMNKAVRLQGNGTGSTFINGNPNPLDRLQAWHARIDALGGVAFADYLQKDPFQESEAPTIIVMGETPHPDGTNQAPGPNTLYFNPGNPFNTPGQAAVDGFNLTGSKAGGGFFAVSGARYLTVSNNNITGNQGNYAGGLAIGTQDSGFDALNANITLRYNKIHKNGGVQGPGGIAMNEYSNNYLIQENLIAGNLSRFNGGAINHRGVSLGENVIRGNKILFNEDFYGAFLAKAGDGGGIYVGGDVVGGTGAGNITIDGNLIQGNMTGSGYGGGIRAFAINGTDDVSGNPEANWYKLRILNNIIVNNVAALAGAGISLQDVARAVIINNTIANNDSTAVGQLAFTAGQPNSNPQIAGIHSGLHSDLLIGLLPPGDPTYSKPVLANNIIWQNRSWFYNSALPAPPGGVPGGLAPRPAGQFWDLGVDLNAGTLDPTYCIITSTAGVGGSNNLQSNPAFLSPYFNTLTTAQVIDEGGNNINVHYTPLIPNSGNYHINSGSPAVNNGTNAYIATYPALALDFDRQNRPSGATSDRGADEVLGGGGGGASYAISGAVRTAANVPISGVTVTLRQGAVVIQTATTNSLGSYQLTGVSNGTYTVTPTRTGYTLTPTSRTVVVSGANRFGINFTGALGAGARILRSATRETNSGTVTAPPQTQGTESPSQLRTNNGKALRLKNQSGANTTAPLRTKGQRFNQNGE